MKNFRKVVCCLLAVAMIVAMLPAVGMKAEAKSSKKVYYVTMMSANKQGIKKMSMKGNTLTMWCTTSKKAYSYSKAEKNYFSDNKVTSYKKRTFKLSKNCKFYAIGEYKTRYSKSEFKNGYVTQPGLGLEMVIIMKNGKVVEIDTCS